MYNEDTERFRDDEYPGLKGGVFLDHGGATLYAKSAIEAFAADLTYNLYGNPHSDSRPSVRSTQRVESVRRRALRFFNASPEYFDLVFVQNTTAAIKLVADAFADAYRKTAGRDKGVSDFWYGYHKDCHTSLVGVREMTNATSRCFVSDEEVEDWLSCSETGQAATTGHMDKLGLFAYPGQSNMTGRRLPFDWCAKLRNSPTHSTTFSLFDAAALATTAPIDLSNPARAPDFTTVAFYKIFGFPDLAALILRKGDASRILQSRRYFGGGTVDMVTCVGSNWHAKKNPGNDAHYNLHDTLEDGTLPYHNIIALDHALDAHERFFTSMSRISSHTAYLGARLFSGLKGLHHANGLPLVRIYTDPQVQYGNPHTTGATIALNVQRSDGSLVSWQHVEKCANARSIFVRGGGLCNPGGVATYLGLTAADYEEVWANGYRCGNPSEQAAGGRTLGVVRVSLGAMSTKSDVDTFLQFLKDEFLMSKPDVQPSIGGAQVAELEAYSHPRRHQAVDGTVITTLAQRTGEQAVPLTTWSVSARSVHSTSTSSTDAEVVSLAPSNEVEDRKVICWHCTTLPDNKVSRPKRLLFKLKGLI